MNPVLQSKLMDPPWALRNGTGLPGTGPIEADDWIRLDEAYAGQMALRDQLIAESGEIVHAITPQAFEAAQEILEMALGILAGFPGFGVAEHIVTRPDGVIVPLDRDAPLLTLGRLVQEDICLLQKSGDAHVLTGAILCFPASWALAEKFNKPLVGIHEPVPEYTADIAKRVQRLFDAIKPGRPMVRANCLLYADPDLHQPRRENQRRDRPGAVAEFVRTERQCFVRLPRSEAVAFTIHTTVVERSALSALDQTHLTEYLESHVSI